MKNLIWAVLSTLVFSTPAMADLRVEGILRDDTTVWKTADSPIVLTGDVVVPEGKSLTVEEGVTVIAEAEDHQRMGVDPDKVELHVAGFFRVNGSAAKPVVFTSRSRARGAWSGLILDGVNQQVSFSKIEYADRAITASTSITLEDVEMENHSDSCLLIYGRKATVRRAKLSDCGRDAIYVGPLAAIELTHSVVRESGRSEFAVRLHGEARLKNNTVAYNVNGGVLVDAQHSAKFTFENNILAFNGRVGLWAARSPNPVSCNFNNSFGHESSDYQGDLVDGAKEAMTKDPKFVSRTDLRLQSDSPCRRAGNDYLDMGAVAALRAAKLVVEVANAAVEKLDLKAKEVRTLNVKALDASNNPLADIKVSWNYSGSAVAGTLVVDPKNPAKATFTANCEATSAPQSLVVSAEGLQRTLPVTVAVGEATTLDIQPKEGLTLRANATEKVTAKVLDACLKEIPGQIEWSVTSGAGSLTNGNYTAPKKAQKYDKAITAKLGSLSASIDVIVTSGAPKTIEISSTKLTVKPSELQALTARTLDEHGNPTNDRPTWRVLKSEAGTITASGQFQAKTKAGRFTDALEVSLAGTGEKKLVEVEVQPGEASKLILNSDSVTLAPNGVNHFVAEVKDAFDNVVTERVDWKLETSEAGALDANGVFTASRKPGTYTNAIRVTAGKLAPKFVTVIIQPGSVQRVVIEPPVTKLRVGEKMKYTAYAADAYDNKLDLPVQWQASSTAGTVSQDGEFTATQTSGTYENAVRATAGGVTARLNLEVTPGDVSSLKLSIQNVEVQEQTHYTFTATARDVFGNELKHAPLVWTALPAAGTITSKGVFTAGSTAGEYDKAVTVAYMGMSDSAKIKVTKEGGDQPNDNPQGCSHVGFGEGFSALTLLSLWALRRRLSRPVAQP